MVIHMPLERFDFEIADPRPIAAEAPYTFFLPSGEQLGAIKQADLVKLMFEYSHQTEKWAAERMWVKVSEAEDDRLRGILENVPDEPTSPLSLGDVIEFRRHHVLAIEWENPEKAPPPADYREYWDRCLVDDCVLEGGVPVEFIYREDPDMTQAGDTYPDSGWRIRGRQGASTDAEMEARKLSYVALGAVLNQDDSWLSWIDAPVGTALMRDFDTGSYVAQD
ncbi:immunity protein Imm33 domain-containing protein [Novosphingobium sp.]|uniref:immunity protein Imm33 domain-containing protein n=1 Tax=Novosphingobium sp. TaxID=1874826 RepID=UPI002FDA0A9A